MAYAFSAADCAAAAAAAADAAASSSPSCILLRIANAACASSSSWPAAATAEMPEATERVVTSTSSVQSVILKNGVIFSRTPTSLPHAHYANVNTFASQAHANVSANHQPGITACEIIHRHDTMLLATRPAATRHTPPFSVVDHVAGGHTRVTRHTTDV
jgi:hypothetical protein